jgi:hypothetical protein
MPFGDEAWKRKNTEDCIRGVIERDRTHLGLRDHEVERAVQIGADLANTDRSLNWGQLANAGATAVTGGH